MLIRTFMKLQAVDPGFDTHHVLTMSMSISGDRFQKTAGVARIVRRRYGKAQSCTRGDECRSHVLFAAAQ